MKQMLSAAALVALALAITGPATAQMSHAQGEGMVHMPGMTHDMSSTSDAKKPAANLPTEPGQGAFAAIAEIVAMLRADPATDWSRVDIAALRAHLVDMNRLTLDAEAVATPIPGGLRIAVSLQGPGGGAASRMVPAHAPVLAAETGWHSAVTKDEGKLIWTVTDPTAEAQIRALGFFGLMAVGDHHRAHHLAMATGAMMH